MYKISSLVIVFGGFLLILSIINIATANQVDPTLVLNIIPVKPKLDPVKDIFIPSNFIIVFREYLKFLITKFHI